MNNFKAGKRIFFAGNFFLFILFNFLLANTLFGAENYYYSIHIASFKNLKNANNYVNAMSKKGKVIFWKEADVPDKGLWHRVYLGKYKNRKEAVEYWNVLKEQGEVSYFGVHKFSEIDVADKEESLPEDKVIPDSKDDLTSDTQRFVDNKDGTVTDNKTNLMWIKNGWRLDFFAAAKWQEAQEKCKEFKLAGFSDWRLPTIREWKSLLDKKNEYPAMVEPNPFENIIVHMPYWSKTEYKSKQLASVRNSLFRVYTVMLYYGRIGHQNTSKRAFIMPVRAIK